MLVRGRLGEKDLLVGKSLESFKSRDHFRFS